MFVQPFQNSILNEFGLAMTTERIVPFYLFPHKFMNKIRVRGDEASADNTQVSKLPRKSAGSGSTNYCEFFKTSDHQEWVLLR